MSLKSLKMAQALQYMRMIDILISILINIEGGLMKMEIITIKMELEVNHQGKVSDFGIQ